MHLSNVFTLIINSVFSAFLQLPPRVVTPPQKNAVITPNPTERIEVKQEKPKATGLPIKIIIPKINLDSDIEPEGLGTDGLMVIPTEGKSVSWFKLGTKPGDIGNAVIAGHYETIQGPAVFYNLKNLNIGDEINVLDSAGNKLIFKINNIEIVDVGAFDVQKVYGTGNNKSLNLITCNGNYNPNIKSYDKRLIVYSNLSE